MKSILKKIAVVTIFSFSLLCISCADSARSTKRNLSGLSPGQNGGSCSSQISADIKQADEICNIKGYSWQKHDIYMNCFEELNSLKISYPDLNCSLDKKKRTAKDIDTLYADIKRRIYQYKTGKCGSEPILNYNESFKNYNSKDKVSIQKLINNLEDFADRYRGINCQTTEKEINLSSSSKNIMLTRELINKVIKDISKKSPVTQLIPQEAFLNI